MIVVMAVAWMFARNLLLVFAHELPGPTHHFSTMVFFWLATAGRGPGGPSIEIDLPGFPSIVAVKAILVGDVVVLVVVIIWLRWAFDVMVGRTTYKLLPSFRRRPKDGDVSNQRREEPAKV